MMDVEASYSDFINCDRTGRRNAVPDITREGGQGPAGTSELAKDMAEMDLKAAGRLTCREILMRLGPSGTPAEAFIFVNWSLHSCIYNPREVSSLSGCWPHHQSHHCELLSCYFGLPSQS